MGKLILPLLSLISKIKSSKVNKTKIAAVLIAVGLTATGININIGQIEQLVELMAE